MFAVPLIETPALCADPSLLPLVDAAFDSPASDAAYELRNYLCPRCPSERQCLTLGMAQSNPGIWGGTSQNQRTRAGAPGNATTQTKRNALAR